MVGRPKLKPRQAFMAWVVGKSREIRYKLGGNMSEGIINPPRIMEGRKMDWLKRTIERESGETTPISNPRLAKVSAVKMNINVK